jgi:hypothetical protein
MPKSKSKKYRFKKTSRSELLLYLVIFTVISAGLLFYTGEYNIIKNLPNTATHRFASLFGQLMLTFANATLVMASICFVLDRQDARLNRVFQVTRHLFLYNTIGIMLGATLYAILTILAKFDSFTITACGIILVIGAIAIKSRPHV